MVKNERNRGSHSEEYDGEALRELIDMSKLYVAHENGFTGKGKDVPDGSFSDFSCSVWEMLNDAIRYGMWLQRKKSEKEKLERVVAGRRHFVEEYEQKLKDFDMSWQKPVLEDEEP